VAQSELQLLRVGRSRVGRLVHAMALAALVLALPGPALADGPIERIVERDHRIEILQVVSDDVCGDVGGGLGLRSGVFRMVETGHRHISIYEDRYHVVDVENGTYSYDFDDPSIPDVYGYRYTSPFSLVVTKGENVLVTENQHEMLPGSPDGIRISFRYHLTWRDGRPQVEREFFAVSGCP
jgi:hypothetical protein